MVPIVMLECEMPNKRASAISRSLVDCSAKRFIGRIYDYAVLACSYPVEAAEIDFVDASRLFDASSDTMASCIVV